MVKGCKCNDLAEKKEVKHFIQDTFLRIYKTIGVFSTYVLQYERCRLPHTKFVFPATIHGKKDQYTCHRNEKAKHRDQSVTVKEDIQSFYIHWLQYIQS